MLFDMYTLTFINFVVLALIMQQYTADGQGITSCTYDATSCSCVTNLGTIYLDTATRHIPYNATNTKNLDLFYWEPCKDYTYAKLKGGAFRKVQNKGTVTVIGVHSHASSSVTDGYASFNMQTADSKMFVSVNCACGSAETFVFVSAVISNNFVFTLTSNACCPQSKPSPSSSSAGISIGSIMTIVFFVVLIGYLVLGTIFQISVRKAQGRERIPNVAVWSAIPGLIRDGFIFTFTCGKRNGYSAI